MCINDDFNELGHHISNLVFINKGFIHLMENNHSGLPSVFLEWVKSLYEIDMVMKISRILEKNPKGITLPSLLNKIKTNDVVKSECKTDIEKDLESIEKSLEKFKVIRDKIMAHFDRDFRERTSESEVVKHSDFDAAENLIIDIFNKYHKSIIGGEHIFITSDVVEIFNNISITYNQK